MKILIFGHGNDGDGAQTRGTTHLTGVNKSHDAGDDILSMDDGHNSPHMNMNLNINKLTAQLHI